MPLKYFEKRSVNTKTKEKNLNDNQNQIFSLDINLKRGSEFQEASFEENIEDEKKLFSPLNEIDQLSLKQQRIIDHSHLSKKNSEALHSISIYNSLFKSDKKHLDESLMKNYSHEQKMIIINKDETKADQNHSLLKNHEILRPVCLEPPFDSIINSNTCQNEPLTHFSLLHNHEEDSKISDLNLNIEIMNNLIYYDNWNLNINHNSNSDHIEDVNSELEVMIPSKMEKIGNIFPDLTPSNYCERSVIYNKNKLDKNNFHYHINAESASTNEFDLLTRSSTKISENVINLSIQPQYRN